MNSVKFGEKDSFKDWGLILKPKSRPFPTPKETYVSIEGKDGDLDLTTSLTDDVKYNNYVQSLEFTLNDKREDWETKMQEITTYLHGKKLNVVFSEDAEWFAIGRMSVNELKSNKNIGSIVIDCNFEPYRLKVEETIIEEAIETGKVIDISNSRKWVMPTFKPYSENLVDFSKPYTITNAELTFENDILVLSTETTKSYDGPRYDILEIIKENAGRTLRLDYDSISETNPAESTAVGTINLKINGSNVYHTFIGKFSDDYVPAVAYYTIPKDVSGITSATLILFTNNSSSRVGISNTLTIEKPILHFGTEKIGYSSYVENPYVNFTFEDKEFSISGITQTPDIILKEGTSKITLNSGEGNIKISYREGKL